MHSLKKRLEVFLTDHFKAGAPLLVAFSGGPDSLALTSLLLELKDKYSLEIELAHVDHGYRKESSDEALGLQKWSLEKKIPFHLMKIEEVPTKNVEDTFRKKRYDFFEELFKKRSYAALLLAHHRDDLEETVLKRMLEGAFISNLCPIKSISFRNGIQIWRPLLQSSKAEILQYIKKHNLVPIIDKSNFDGSNLRSKMRMKIIPLLEKELGKNIRTSLFNLAQYSDQLSSYLQAKTQNLACQTNKTQDLSIDFSNLNLHPLEMHYFLKQTLKDQNISLSRKELSTAIYLIQNKSVGKTIIKKNVNLYFDGQKLFIKSKI